MKGNAQFRLWQFAHEIRKHPACKFDMLTLGWGDFTLWRLWILIKYQDNLLADQNRSRTTVNICSKSDQPGYYCNCQDIFWADLLWFCCLWLKNHQESISSNLGKNLIKVAAETGGMIAEVKGKQTHSLRSLSMSVWDMWGGTSLSDLLQDIIHAYKNTHWGVFSNYCPEHETCLQH